MSNFLILAIFFLLFLFEFEAIIFVSFHMIYTYKLRVIGISVRVHFFFWYLNEPWETRQFDIIRSQQLLKELKKSTLNNNNSCNNNFKYCFNKLYYDCKHLIVLIIVECRLGLVQWATRSRLGFNNRSFLSIGECPSNSPFLKINGAEAHCF